MHDLKQFLVAYVRLKHRFIQRYDRTNQQQQYCCVPVCPVRRGKLSLSIQGNWLSQILDFGAKPHSMTFSAFHSVQPMNSLDWTVWFNVPVKSKLQHPLSGYPPPPGHLNYWKIFVQIPPPSPGRKAVQMPPPSGKLLDYCFNFSEASIMLLKLCMCKHGLLDNMPYMPQDSGHTVFHVNTSSQHCRWTLHHYCTSREAAKIILI